ncbi:hypothetical protein KIPB_003630 [Kipferlia bialata]|uniref:DUF4200 domain-containing protein n=1 Tax=Kipferlia bialata TaxID=797122 RepID=A0A9K3GHK9_9EUKA|nr:hypothetical protein KIPB_003630 [Kipferlia bialata]|eukprot:g3630.t1
MRRQKEARIVFTDTASASDTPDDKALSMTTVLRNSKRQSTYDYIQSQNEAFLLRMGLDVRDKEVKDIDAQLLQKRTELDTREAKLVQDTQGFDVFLRDNDTTAVKAIKEADIATKQRVVRQQEIRRLNTQLLQLRTELSRLEERVVECHKYRVFLESVSSQEFRERQAAIRAKNVAARKAAALKREAEEGQSTVNDAVAAVVPPSALRRLVPVSSLLDSDWEHFPVSDPGLSNSVAVAAGAVVGDDTHEVHFERPDDLLAVFTTLEDSNLFYIQRTQEIDSSIEATHKAIQQTIADKEVTTRRLLGQLSHLEALSRVRAAATTSNPSASGSNDAKARGKRLEQEHLRTMLETAYRACIGSDVVALDSTDMMARIETRLEHLLAEVERNVTPERFRQLEQGREKARRSEARQERMQAREVHNRERMRRALERAAAPAKRRVGRTPMVRSFNKPRRQPVQRTADTGESALVEEETDFYTIATGN